MKKKIKKSVRIQDSGVQLHMNVPKEFAEELKLKKGDDVIMTLEKENKKITIEKV